MRPSVKYRTHLMNKKGHKNSGSKLPYKLWVDINRKAMDLIIELILDNEYGFALPKHLGTILMIGDKNPRLTIDFHKTKLLNEKLGNANLFEKKVYHTNSKTNGIIYGAKWTRYAQIHRFSGVPNLRFYWFRPSHNFKRAIVNRINNLKHKHWLKLDSVKYADLKKVALIKKNNHDKILLEE